MRRTSRRGESATLSHADRGAAGVPVLAGGAAARADVDDAHRLVVGVLGERVLEQRAGVAHRVGAASLRTVQVAERDVVEAGEGAGGHLLGAADAERPLALALEAAGDEGVRDEDVTLVRLGGGERPRHTGGRNRLLVVDVRVGVGGACLGRIGEREER